MIKDIDYSCFMTNCGYSQAARDYIKCLLLKNYKIKITPFSNFDKEHLNKEDVILFENLLKESINKEAYQIFHCIPDRQQTVYNYNKKIGFATFETFDPPEYWLKILENNLAVLCPSKFCYNLFKEKLSRPVYYLPHCIDLKKFNPEVIKEKKDKFTFLFFASWRERKGWKELIEAWVNAFGTKDNVQLIIKTDKFVQAEKDVKNYVVQISNKKDIAPILFENKILTDAELPKFFRSVDCLIFPTKGEGFGLPILQSMAVGTPVIAPSITGCKELIDESWANVLSVEGFVIQECLDMIPQYKKKKWALIKIKEIENKMREVYENVDIAKRKAKKALSIVQNYSYDNVSAIFDNILQSL